MSHMNFVAFQKECEEAMDKLRTAILIFDASGKLCYANERARQILGKKMCLLAKCKMVLKGLWNFFMTHADDFGSFDGKYFVYTRHHWQSDVSRYHNS